MKKSVLITGANRGIGLGLTKLYAKNGWTVYATARDLSTAKELQSLRSDKVQLHSLDISSDESVGQLQREISQISHLDLLINNAGILRGENQGFSELKMLDLAESFDVNVLGAIRVTKACLEKLSKSTSPKVVHITSMMGSITDNRSGGYYAYRISKAALNMMNKSFSVDHPSYTSIVMHPGWVKTDMGGLNATTSIEDSVAGIANVIEGLKVSDSGKFFNYLGKNLPW